MRQSILLLLALALPTASAQQPFDLQAAIGHGLARQEFAQITIPCRRDHRLEAASSLAFRQAALRAATRLGRHEGVRRAS